jgi:hypothetical protein
MTYYTQGLSRLAFGAAAGFAGTLAIQAFMTANQKWFPSVAPSIRQDPGEFMVESVEAALPVMVRERIPEAVESGAATLLALGYGLTFGVLYAMYRPKAGAPLRDGIALGVVNWATGYLGWLPALGLMPPAWQQQPRQVTTGVAEHVVYGITTVAAYHWLQESMLEIYPIRKKNDLGETGKWERGKRVRK